MVLVEEFIKKFNIISQNLKIYKYNYYENK